MNPIQQNVIDALEINNLPSEEREEIIVRVGAIIYQNVLVKVMEGMTEKDKADFEKLLDQNAGPEKIFIFLKSKVPNLEQIIIEEATKFKSKTSSIMDQIGS